MQQGERVIVKLDPDYNPTGKPMPDTLLEEMKADPDFSKLSESEQKKVVKKVKSMIESVDDIAKYGTLKEKLRKCAWFKNFQLNKSDREDIVPFIELPSDENDTQILFDKEAYYLKEGLVVNKGEHILDLVAIDSVDGKPYDDTFRAMKEKMNNSIFNIGFTFNFGIQDGIKVAGINAPIDGKIFSLCEIRNLSKKVNWNDDLFIVSSVPDDTRKEAIKWYKETTGKTPKYKTAADLKAQESEEKKNVDDFLSKWDL